MRTEPFCFVIEPDAAGCFPWQAPPANTPPAVVHDNCAHATERPAGRRAPTTSCVAPQWSGMSQRRKIHIKSAQCHPSASSGPRRVSNSCAAPGTPPARGAATLHVDGCCTPASVARVAAASSGRLHHHARRRCRGGDGCMAVPGARGVIHRCGCNGAVGSAATRVFGDPVTEPETIGDAELGTWAHTRSRKDIP